MFSNKIKTYITEVGRQFKNDRIRKIIGGKENFLQKKELALKPGNDANNTSLAPAIELVDSGKELLFPGDAQVGNRLSWERVSCKVSSGAAALACPHKERLPEKDLYLEYVVR